MVNIDKNTKIMLIFNYKVSDIMYAKKYKTNNNYSNIIMTSDGEYLTGLWFEESTNNLKYQHEFIYKKLDIFNETSKWLDLYFKGIIPNFTPKYKINNITPFRKQVIEIINKIPYGSVITYNDIAKEIAKNNNIKRMSAQAVGNAVGSNPICIIIPCHRVIGINNKLTGYNGGIDNKINLLSHEGLNKDIFKR